MMELVNDVIEIELNLPQEECDILNKELDKEVTY